MTLEEKAPRWRPRGGGWQEGRGTLSCAHCTAGEPCGQFWERLAESLVPNPCRSYEQWERWTHRDIAELSAERLAQEAARIAQVLAWLDRRNPDREWLEERLRRLRGELARRGGNGR
ncbi:MAG: hypothetical protein H5T59_04060 [Anaerolineae bacterium]|nr:hypothetical protein [Anaerolineae bacterium]